MRSFGELYDTFRKSENKIYFFLSSQKEFLFLFVVLTLFFGAVGYILSPKVNGFEVVNKTISLFAFDWIDKNGVFLIIAQFFAILSVFLGAVTLFLKDFINEKLIKSIQRSPYTLVVGLGEQNSAFLESFPRQYSTIVIEADSSNKNIEYFQQKGYGIIVSKAQEAVFKLNLCFLKDAVISTGDDGRNISIASLLAKECQKGERKRIFVRVENRKLSELFSQNVIKRSENADIAVYSLYENIAKALFQKHSILGNFRELIKTDEEFSVVLVGNSLLAEEIFYHLAILSNLPNQNHLNLYLVSKNAKRFYKRVRKIFPATDKISHLNIKAVELDSESFEFYEDIVWRAENLTNIILADIDQKKNLDIAVNLQNRVYLKDIVKGEFKTKVLTALFFDEGLAEAMGEDKEAFKNFFAFGSIKEASSYDNLIDEKLDLIAKMIHYLYTKRVCNPSFLVTDKNREDMERRWYDIESFSDKLSSKMQSLHIDVKLLALGLKKRESFKSPKELLEENRKIFFEKLGDTDIEEKELIEYSKEFAKYYDGDCLSKELPSHFKPLPLPKRYETLFERLVRSEHNRWMTTHFLNGWEYGKSKNKKSKTHNCLVPFEKIDYTAIFDIFSVMYIPNILASAGFEIVCEENFLL